MSKPGYFEPIFQTISARANLMVDEFTQMMEGRLESVSVSPILISPVVIRWNSECCYFYRKITFLRRLEQVLNKITRMSSDPLHPTVPRRTSLSVI
jgi:hypothetical protein